MNTGDGRVAKEDQSVLPKRRKKERTRGRSTMSLFRSSNDGAFVGVTIAPTASIATMPTTVSTATTNTTSSQVLSQQLSSGSFSQQSSIAPTEPASVVVKSVTEQQFIDDESTKRQAASSLSRILASPPLTSMSNAMASPPDSVSAAMLLGSLSAASLARPVDQKLSSAMSTTTSTTATTPAAAAAAAAAVVGGVKRSREQTEGDEETTEDREVRSVQPRRGRSRTSNVGDDDDVDDKVATTPRSRLAATAKASSEQKPRKPVAVAAKQRSASVDRKRSARTKDDSGSDDDDGKRPMVASTTASGNRTRRVKQYKGRWGLGRVLKKGETPTVESPLPIGMVSQRSLRLGKSGKFDVTFEVLRKDGRVVYRATCDKPKLNVQAHSTHGLFKKIYRQYDTYVEAKTAPAELMMIMAVVLGGDKNSTNGDDNDDSDNNNDDDNNNNNDDDGESESEESTVDGDEDAQPKKRAAKGTGVRAGKTPVKAARIAKLKAKLEKVREAPPKLRSSESTPAPAPKKAETPSSAMKRESSDQRSSSSTPAARVQFSLPAEPQQSATQSTAQSSTQSAAQTALEASISLGTPLIDALVLLSDKPREKVELWAEVLTRDDIDTVRDLCALPDQTFERLIALPTISILLQGLLLRLRLQHKK
jgi:hypothetical protein